MFVVGGTFGGTKTLNGDGDILFIFGELFAELVVDDIGVIAGICRYCDWIFWVF